MVARVASSAAVSSALDSTGAMTASAMTNPAWRAAMLIVAAPTSGTLGDTDTGLRMPLRRPRPRPHANSAGAAHPADAAGRYASPSNPPASATPPVTTANRAGSSGPSLRTTIAPSGIALTTNAPVIGDQPHTTTSNNTARNSAPTSAP